jgi:hypothetical protein
VPGGEKKLVIEDFRVFKSIVTEVNSVYFLKCFLLENILK